MNTPLTCTEPLVWTCKACGHSFHAEEWQSRGRQCPACTEKRGDWKCSLCLGSFTQPALQGLHPCKKGSTNDTVKNAVTPTVQRTITLPGWINLKNTLFLFIGLAVLGLAYLIISIKLTQIRQETGQKVSGLFVGAQQALAAGDYEKSIGLYQEMESLTASAPEWGFGAKNGLSRALAKSGRTEEARLKLGEAEQILKKNPNILKGQDLQGAIDFTRNEILLSEKSSVPQPDNNRTNLGSAAPREVLAKSNNSSGSLDPSEAMKRAEMTTLLDNSKKLFQGKDYHGALQGFTELEGLAKEYPNYLFAIKMNLISCLLPLQRLTEAENKFKEMEAMVASNAETRDSPEVKSILKGILREIETSKTIRMNKIEEPPNGADKAAGSFLSEKYVKESNPKDIANPSIAQEPHSSSQGVKWRMPDTRNPSAVTELELAFTSCQPEGIVTIPVVRDVEFFGQPVRSTSFSMIDFQTISTTTLTYSIRTLVVS